MDWTITAFLVFPALLIGTAMGILVSVALSGVNILEMKRAAIFYSIGGAVLGVVVFLATADWWPAVIGPYILSPAGAIAGALLDASLHR